MLKRKSCLFQNVSNRKNRGRQRQRSRKKVSYFLLPVDACSSSMKIRWWLSAPPYLYRKWWMTPTLEMLGSQPNLLPRNSGRNEEIVFACRERVCRCCQEISWVFFGLFSVFFIKVFLPFVWMILRKWSLSVYNLLVKSAIIIRPKKKKNWATIRATILKKLRCILFIDIAIIDFKIIRESSYFLLNEGEGSNHRTFPRGHFYEQGLVVHKFFGTMTKDVWTFIRCLILFLIF